MIIRLFLLLCDYNNGEATVAAARVFLFLCRCRSSLANTQYQIRVHAHLHCIIYMQVRTNFYVWQKNMEEKAASAWYYAHMIQIKPHSLSSSVYLHMRIIHCSIHTFLLHIFLILYNFLALFVNFPSMDFSVRFHTWVLPRHCCFSAVCIVFFSFSPKYLSTLVSVGRGNRAKKQQAADVRGEKNVLTKQNNFPFTSYSLDADAGIQTINSYPILWKNNINWTTLIVACWFRFHTKLELEYLSLFSRCHLTLSLSLSFSPPFFLLW